MKPVPPPVPQDVMVYIKRIRNDDAALDAVLTLLRRAEAEHKREYERYKDALVTNESARPAALHHRGAATAVADLLKLIEGI